VTENVEDFAGERGIAVVCMLKSRLRRTGWTSTSPPCWTGGAAVNPEP
jgi:hypothetical protein